MRKNYLRAYQWWCLALVILAACTGCKSIAEEKRDAANSGYVFYPLAKLGDGLSVVAKPGAWIRKSARPEKAFEPKRRLELANMPRGLKYDFSFDPPIGVKAVGLAADAYSASLRDFLVSVENIVGYSFDWYFSDNVQQGAQAWPAARIFVNTSFFATQSSSANYFTLLHETCHHTLGHTSTEGMIQRSWQTKEQELSADACAFGYMNSSGIFTVSATCYAAWEVFIRFPDSGGYPTAYERINALNCNN